MTNKDPFNRSVNRKQKFLFFIGAWLISTFIIFDAITKFLYILSSKNVLTLPEEFFSFGVVWGDSISLNVIKIIATAITSVTFGVIYFYLSRKISSSDEISVSFAYALFAILGFPLLISYIIAIFSPGETVSILEFVTLITDTVSEDIFLLYMIIAQLIIAIIFTYIGISLGKTHIEQLPKEKGKLFGVNWYHFIWLTPALSIYVQSVLATIYLSIDSIVLYISNFELFGLNKPEEGAKTYSFSGLIWTLIIYYFVAYLIGRLTLVEREVLDNSVKTPVWKKITISILYALIIPFLLIYFTLVGNNY